jgi:hypothetical protein
LDATDYKTEPDKEKTKTNKTVGSGLAWSFCDSNKSKENNRIQDWSQRTRGARLAWWLG